MPDQGTFMQRLTNQPMQTVWRYLWAAIFSGIAIGWYAYSQISSTQIFAVERVGKSITTGLTFGVFFGFVVVLAAEVPERLRGFWPWWGCLLLSLMLGFVSGVLLWILFPGLILYFVLNGDELGGVWVAGIGTAAAFALRAAVRLPAWLAAFWAAIALYTPLELAWILYMPPLIYVRAGEEINHYIIPMALLMAIGAYVPKLFAEARAFGQHDRQRQ